MWEGLRLTYVLSQPEYGRAKEILLQVDQPWAAISNPLHDVVAWRLFFPLAWHYLELPRSWLLAVPQIGCLIVLWLVAWLSYARLRNWWSTCLATILFAALSWFFVSTGWLLYFDSWLVLGLLIVAFVRARFALALACLVTPWVDERFVLALPMSVLLRGVALEGFTAARRGEFLLDLAVITTASIPYPVARVWAWVAGESLTPTYSRAHWTAIQTLPLDNYVEGLWNGYRAAWVMILAAMLLSARRVGPQWGTALILVLCGTAVGGLFIAADMSRTMMMISPAVLLGVWQWETWRPRRWNWVLPGVVAANLLLPAGHAIWNLHIPISSLPEEVSILDDLPPGFAIAALVARAQRALDEKKPEQARDLARQILQINPRDGFAHGCSGIALYQLGRRDGFTSGQLEEVVTELRVANDTKGEAFEYRDLIPTVDSLLAAALLELGRRDGFRPGQHDQILACLDEALALCPDSVDARETLGLALLITNRPADALPHFTRVVEIDPTRPEALYGAAVASRALGQGAAAQDFLVRALEQKPDHALAHFDLGLLFIEQENLDAAQKHLEQALRSDPQLADAHYALAGLLVRRGDLPAAAAEYTAAIRARPKFPRALNNLGVVQMNLGDSQQAIRNFQEAVRHDPHYVEAATNLKNALEAQRESTEAK